MKRTIRAAALFATLWTAPASAYDMAKVLVFPTEDRFVSSRSMYDIERCAILEDAIVGVSVYRQPDRPNNELVAWGTAIVIELEAQAGGTKVSTHFTSPADEKRASVCSTARPMCR
jgi:hypothetical protein